MVAVCYHDPVNLHIRDLPDDIHTTLASRAHARRMSLRAYVVDVLAAHSALPTTDEWLASLETLPQAGRTLSAADAVNAERDDRDDEIVRAARGR
jgi:plasmid stability protein